MQSKYRVERCAFSGERLPFLRVLPTAGALSTLNARRGQIYGFVILSFRLDAERSTLDAYIRQ
jgi:hypothetical protein